MLKNYLTITLRHLRRQAGYSFINVGGLALGLACAFLIVLYVQHERSFDQFHEKGERIYRLFTHVVQGENAGYRSAIFATGYASELKARYPEIEAAVLYDDRTPYLKVENENHQTNVAFMGEDAFSVFTFPLVRGNPETALAAPYSIVLTESAATALFGQADPLGQQINYDDDFDVTVTGVMEDVPANSHLQFEALLPIALMKEVMGDENALMDFTNYNYYLYLLLAPGTDAEQLEDKFFGYRLERNQGDEEAARSYRYELQPLSAIHFTTDIDWDVGTNVSPRYVYLFAGIALLIVLIAGVNFMNLATARAAQRAKEVGVRKVVGAQRKQLIVQFLGESVLLSVIAIVLALGLTALFLPTFRDIIGSDVAFRPGDLGTLALLVGVGLAAGVLAGSYPAFYLSAFRPATVLKGEITKGRHAALLRRGLIVLQFGISIFLIISTLTIYNQLRYMQSKALGFDKEQVVFVRLTDAIQDSYDAFKQTLLQNPRVLNVTQAGNLPGRVNTSRGYNWPGQAGEEENGRSFYTVLAHYDYLETLGLDLVAGRDFSEDMPTDFEDAYILNESAARELGYATPDEAVGQPFRAWDKEMGEIIGVVRDFHFQSLHQDIAPVVINIKPWIGLVAFRIAPDNVPETMDYLLSQWERFSPGFPFSYTFLDEDFDRLYRTEEDLGKLFMFFAGIAIFVACLGLFGLAAYSAAQRTKEIGIRKVLGASVRSITMLLSKEFTVLVLVAFVLAAPAAFFVMHSWLDGFAYRTSIGVGTFALAAMLAVVIAWLTVSYQALKAAVSDPVKALRYE